MKPYGKGTSKWREQGMCLRVAPKVIGDLCFYQVEEGEKRV
jgi:hypothetical protein